jgi:hypothetical protein
MKQLKHEAELVKAAILAGMKYSEDRGAVVFEKTDSASEKILFIYRLLVHDKVIQPLPEDQVSQSSIRSFKGSFKGSEPFNRSELASARARGDLRVRALYNDPYGEADTYSTY